MQLWNFPSSLGMIVSLVPHVEQSPIDFPPKDCTHPHEKPLLEKSPPYLREETQCFIFISLPIFNKSFIPIYSHSLELWPLESNYLANVFFKVEYGYEIFKTILSLNCKII